MLQKQTNILKNKKNINKKNKNLFYRSDQTKKYWKIARKNKKSVKEFTAKFLKNMRSTKTCEHNSYIWKGNKFFLNVKEN